MSLAVTSNYFEADDLKPKPVVTFVNETTGVEIVSLRVLVVTLMSCTVSPSSMRVAHLAALSLRCGDTGVVHGLAVEHASCSSCCDDEGHTKPRVLPAP
jgi:hypothetical protein